ncbi:hypothetical protein L2E82_49267 [Cichorium intybus]|uniref:Uncharacterized protein n=1 Tax=Cichorium intybus TaxID=13427 RepID=A0ACB8Z120_CICIN|nr:hypothetical protein L2E82_49267 [Cichorium intybus]
MSDQHPIQSFANWDFGGRRRSRPVRNEKLSDQKNPSHIIKEDDKVGRKVYSDDPNEPDHRVHDWVKSLKEQTWTKELSEQEILNQSRIRVYYSVIDRPVKEKHTSSNTTEETSSDDDDPAILKLKIKIAKLELKLAKSKEDKPEKIQKHKTHVKQTEQQQFVKNPVAEPRKLIAKYFRRINLPTQRYFFDNPEIIENPVSLDSSTEVELHTTDTDTSIDDSSSTEDLSVSSDSDSETETQQSNPVQEIVYEPIEHQVNGISSLRYIDIKWLPIFCQ